LAPARADGLADQDFAVVVALGRVDHVEAGVERAAEKLRDRARAGALVPDLGAAEAEHADVHVGLAELAMLHHPSIGRSTLMRPGSSPFISFLSHFCLLRSRIEIILS